MSEEKMNEPKTTSPDELAKPKKPGDIQLNEQELGEVSVGQDVVLRSNNVGFGNLPVTQSRSDGGGSTVGRAN